jgi:YD repeat-containing protein
MVASLTVAATISAWKETSAWGGIHTFEYDDVGRLVKDSDAAGGFQALTKVQTSTTQHEVTVTTAEGRTEKYLRQAVGLKGETFTRTYVDGTTSLREAPNDGSHRLLSSANTETKWTDTGDARFGMDAAFAGRTLVTLPSGLVSEVLRSNEVEYRNNDVAKGIAKFSTSVQQNNRAYTSTYEAATKTFTSVTPEGRSSTVTVDAKGRAVSVQAPGLTPAAMVYNDLGQLTQVKQGARMLEYGYNALGKVERVKDALGAGREQIRTSLTLFDLKASI